MGVFNSDGYIRERLDEWVTNVQNIYFGIFGTSFDLSGDTQDGQLVAAFAEAQSNEDQKAEAVSKAFNPNEADGVSLSTLVQLNGITRNESTSSIVTLSMTGVNGTIIPAGSKVRNVDTDEQFATDGSATISGGTASVQATAIISGPIIATAGTLTIIDDNISGWTSVTNNNDATVGNDEETDADLRIRRRASVAKASTGNVDSVNGSIISLDGVISSVVKENDTNSTDLDGLPAHSIAPVVEGGTDADIGLAIWQNKSGGCVTFGIGTGITAETIVDSQGFDHIINFSRPEDVDIHIEMAITELAGFPNDGEDQIKQAIVDYFSTDVGTRLLIGDDVIYSEVYIPIMSVPGVSVTSLTIGLTTSPVGVIDLEMDFYEFARFDTARIDIS